VQLEPFARGGAPIDESTESPLEVYLKADERLCHLLWNTQTGVERHGEQRRPVHPGEGGTAYMGLTDRRIFVLVADPVGHDHDFVTSYRYANIDGVTVAATGRTVLFEFETGHGQRWSFTAAESDAEPVRAFLSLVCREAATADRALLRSHCVALSDHLAAGEWAAFDERATAALELLDQRNSEIAGQRRSATDGPAGLSADLHCLVRDRYVLAGREHLASARPRLDAGDLELSYRRARTAYDNFERAFERAERVGVASKTAMVGLTMADDIADTSLGRLLATGRKHHAAASDSDTLDERIAALETAFDIYGTAEALITGDETLSDSASARTKDASAAVTESLLQSRLDAAVKHRQAADWERTVRGDEAAREPAETARGHLERALELATSYSPGDPAEIRARLDALRSAFDTTGAARDA